MLPQEEESRGTSSKKWDGITVDGKPLNKFFKDEHAKDLPEVVDEEQKLKKTKKRRVYIRQKPSENKRSSKMTVADQTKLNAENLKSNLAKTEALQKRILIYLLGGIDFNAEELQHWELKDYDRKVAKQQIWSALSAINRTGIAQFIIRNREKYKGNVMFRYNMDEEGLQLEPEQAFALLKQVKPPKSKKKPPTKKKKKTSAKGKTKKSPQDYSEDGRTAKTPAAKRATGKDVEITIMDGKPTDLNLNINGRVDVYFHFKLG